LKKDDNRSVWRIAKDDGSRAEVFSLSKGLKSYVARKLTHFVSADVLLPAVLILGAIGTAFIAP
jgi:hypothetical protein